MSENVLIRCVRHLNILIKMRFDKGEKTSKILSEFLLVFFGRGVFLTQSKERIWKTRWFPISVEHEKGSVTFLVYSSSNDGKR